MMNKLVMFSLVLSLGQATLAQARSPNLWNENDSAQAPLANVPDFRTLAQSAVPAVVSIMVEQRVKVSRGNQRNDPFSE
ncbi:MAG: hypothetical protein R3C68_10715 [Myxococcota bacterium]